MGNLKKFSIILAVVLSLIWFSGCTQNLKTNSEGIKVTCENFSDKENYILLLTGNNAVKYNINNLPIDKDYELNLVYEVYENGTKVKEEILTGIRGGEPEDNQEPIKSQTIGLNLQEDKLRMVWGTDSASSLSDYEFEEDLNQYSRCFLQENKTFKLGEEMYLFYANSSDAFSVVTKMWDPTLIGTALEEKGIDLKENSKNKMVFIKLMIKEI